MTQKEIIEYKQMLNKTFVKGAEDIEYLTAKVCDFKFSIMYYFADFLVIKYIILFSDFGFFKTGTYDSSKEKTLSFQDFIYRKLLEYVAQLK